ncbi:CAP domain-containing protein [Nocardioides humi]|nr:CAP domain-containing protein [Nocardioides humi]
MAPPRLVVLLLLGLLLPLAGPAASATDLAAPADPAQAASRVAAKPAPKKLEKAVLAKVNKHRAAAGCRPLVLKKKLRKAARRHSTRMAAAGTLSHQLPGEPDLGARISATGYRWSALAENIAVGQRTPKAVVRAWMGSAGHRQNILDCSMRHTGIGAVRQGRTVWWTQDFGRR